MFFESGNAHKNDSWPIHHTAKPGFGRQPPQHSIINLKPFGLIAHDDMIHINTQTGSQWDGLKHFGHAATEKYYNGLAHDDVASSTELGIHHWSERGGIVGRGVLLDYALYSKKKGIKYDVTSSHEIDVNTLEAVAEEEKVDFRPGDILIVRSGFTEWYLSASQQGRQDHVTNGGALVGVAANESTIAWLWNNHFAAIAGDTVAFEVWPPTSPFLIHTYALAMWGMPIGEMWDLEKLSKICEKEGRWTFFLTSAPLNVFGGVASPPNALAIF